MGQSRVDEPRVPVFDVLFADFLKGPQGRVELVARLGVVSGWGEGCGRDQWCGKREGRGKRRREGVETEEDGEREGGKEDGQSVKRRAWSWVTTATPAEPVKL